MITDDTANELLPYMQARGEQLAEEHAELVALRHELNQRDRELSRRATEQATEAANTQVCHLCKLPCQLQETWSTSPCSQHVWALMAISCLLQSRGLCCVAFGASWLPSETGCM